MDFGSDLRYNEGDMIRELPRYEKASCEDLEWVHDLIAYSNPWVLESIEYWMTTKEDITVSVNAWSYRIQQPRGSGECI